MCRTRLCGVTCIRCGKETFSCSVRRHPWLQFKQRTQPKTKEFSILYAKSMSPPPLHPTGVSSILPLDSKPERRAYWPDFENLEKSDSHFLHYDSQLSITCTYRCVLVQHLIFLISCGRTVRAHTHRELKPKISSLFRPESQHTLYIAYTYRMTSSDSLKLDFTDICSSVECLNMAVTFDMKV